MALTVESSCSQLTLVNINSKRVMVFITDCNKKSYKETSYKESYRICDAAVTITLQKHNSQKQNVTLHFSVPLI